MAGVARIVSIGAAVQDVFLRGKIFEPKKEKNGDLTEEFALGTKNEVDAITYSTGGGATNASVTFARQGLNSSYLGTIGKDIAGKAVMDDLRSENVNTTLVDVSETEGTGYSTILLSPNGERTILTYRGASSHYKMNEDRFFNTAPDWFYISSLSGDIEALKVIVKYAEKHGIKIAINPGKGELSHKHFKELLGNFDILSLNKEEMQILFGDKKEIDELLRLASAEVGLVLITDGPKGSYVTDGSKIYKAGMYEDVPVIDRAGAGDAFTSGFVASIIREKSVEDALTFASANSTSVVGKIGAKPGILHKGHKIHSMKITVKNLHV